MFLSHLPHFDNLFRKSATSARKTASERLKDSICKLANEKGRITRKDVEDTFGFGSIKAFKYLKILCTEEKIRQEKYENQTTYVPV